MSRRRHSLLNNLFANLLLNLSATLFLISIAVIITINFKPLYYTDINLLDIEKYSGYSKEIIKDNYNTLIKYCSPFFKNELNFPSLDMSDTGKIHFEEVKVIFVKIYFLALISGILSVVLIIPKIINKEFRYLRSIAITSVLIPFAVLIAIAANFSNTFELFHKIFFNNDYWQFDPLLDPVIKILPSEFFMHCAIMIVFLVLLFSFCIYLLYRGLKSVHDDQYIR